MHTIVFKQSVEKDLKKIDKQFISRILEKIENLGEEPHPPSSRKLVDTTNTYRLRVGDYRVIYQVDDASKVITVVYVRHRKDAYK